MMGGGGCKGGGGRGARGGEGGGRGCEGGAGGRSPKTGSSIFLSSVSIIASGITFGGQFCLLNLAYLINRNSFKHIELMLSICTMEHNAYVSSTTTSSDLYFKGRNNPSKWRSFVSETSDLTKRLSGFYPSFPVGRVDENNSAPHPPFYLLKTLRMNS